MTPSRPPQDPYARLPELYDLEHASFQDDIDFYAGFIEAVGDPVLELGCGTGRLLLPISAAGYRVTGLDRSGPMLARARRHISERELEDLITLFHGSITDADQAPGGPFGIALVPLNGFLHLPTAEVQRAALVSVRRALDPRGQLLIDLFNPTAETLRTFDHAVIHEGTWTLPDGTRADKFTARRASHATQAIHTELWYDLTEPDGALRRIATSYEMRYIHRAELELMLELAGYAEWQIYGNYDLEPFDDGSDRLIVAAEVTPSR